MPAYRNPVVLFLKATTTKTITVPGYYRKDGTYVPPHQKVVHYDPDKSVADVLSGKGSHSQKVAHKKLSGEDWFAQLSPEEQHAHILSWATDYQKKQSAAAAVSGWKAAMLAGKKPTASQQAAFDALPKDKQLALGAEVGLPTSTVEAQGAKPAEQQPKGVPETVTVEPQSGKTGPTTFPLPPAEFESYAAAQAWAESRAKAMGMQKKQFEASHEYAYALPAIMAAYEHYMKGWKAEKAAHANAMQAKMAEAGVKPGDVVSWSVVGAFMNSESHSGVVKLSADGVPYVHLGYEVPVAKKGGKIGYVKKIAWQPYMLPAGAAAPAESAAPAEGWKPSPEEFLALQTATNDEKHAKLKEWAEKLGGTEKLVQVLEEAKAQVESGAGAPKSKPEPKPAQKPAHGSAVKPTPNIGDVLVGPIFDLPPGTIVSFMHGDKPLRALIGRDYVWFEKMKGSGWQKNPLALYQTQQFLLGAYSKDGVKVEALGHDHWMPAAQSAMVEKMKAMMDTSAGHPSVYRLGSVVVIGVVGHPSSFRWVNEQGEWGAGFTESQRKQFVSGDGLVPMEDGPKEGDIKQGADGMLVFKNGRWHKVAEPDEPADTAGEHAAAGDAGEPKSLEWSVFHNTTAGHNKFWAVTVDGNKLITHYGKIGAKGTTTVKEYPSEGAALNAGTKLAASKTNGGYVFNGHEHYPVPDGAKTAPKPASAAVTTKPAIESADGWPQTGSQKGSNPGGRFRDPAGQEWYIKFPESEAHARNELLAAKLYEAAGVKVPDLKLVRRDGKVGIASKWIDGLKKVDHPDELSLADGAMSGFVVDAWLANWDVTGLGYDNLLIGPDGKAVRIDAGGALLFRAQGNPKGDAFGTDVPELETLLDPKKNSQSAAVFSGISKQAMKKSAERVLSVPDDVIRDTVLEFGPGTMSERSALADKLIARKAAIAAAFPSAKGAKESGAPVYRIPAPPDFKNWYGPGKGLSSKAAFNDQNQQIAQSIYEAGKSGKLDAVKSMTFQPINEAGEPVGAPALVSQHPSQHVRAYWNDMMQSMVTPYVSPKVSAEKALKKMSAAFVAVRKMFPGFKALKEAAQKVGRYAILGKASPGHPLENWKPKTVSRKQGTLNEADLYKASQSNFAKLSHVEKQAIRDYTGSGYDEMNSALIQGTNHDKAYNAIRGVEKASVLLPPGTVLSRRFSFNKAADGSASLANHEKAIADLLGAGEGAILQEFGIISTSTRSNFWHGSVHMKITVGEGVKGLYVDRNPNGSGGSISKHPGESEIMLPFGTKFMVTKIHKKGHSFSDETGDWGKKSGDQIVIEVVALPNI